MPKGCAMEAKKEPSRFRQFSILIRKKLPTNKPTAQATKQTPTKLKPTFINAQFSTGKQLYFN